MTGSRYFIPSIGGAAVSAAIRLVFADMQVAVTGLVVFAVVFGVLILLGQAMKWPQAPVKNAIFATFATTAAYTITGH